MAKKNTKTSLALSRADLRAAHADSAALGFASAGFVSADTFAKPEGAITKTMSPMVKPAAFPVGQVFVGIFRRIFETAPGKNDDGTDKKGEGVEIIPEGADIGISLPCVATLKTGLEITGTGKEATSPYLGRKVAIQKMPERIPSKKGNSAWHFIVSIFPADSAETAPGKK